MESSKHPSRTPLRPPCCCRGSAAIVEALTAFTPALPSDDSGLGAVALLPHLAAGCAASILLLQALTLTKGEGLASPTAAYRLGCAGLALGCGPAVVQAAQRYAAGAPGPGLQVAINVATACQLLLVTGIKAHLLVDALGQQQPGPALRATTCKHERLLAVCLTCTPVLSFWRKRLGELGLGLKGQPPSWPCRQATAAPAF